MKTRSLISSMLAGFMALSVTVCSSCSNDKQETGNSENLVESAQPHFANNTLHKVTVTETNTPFIQNGQSAYQILTTEKAEAQQAAAFIQSRLYDATGCVLPIVIADGQTWNDSANPARP